MDQSECAHCAHIHKRKGAVHFTQRKNTSIGLDTYARPCWDTCVCTHSAWQAKLQGKAVLQPPAV